MAHFLKETEERQDRILINKDFCFRGSARLLMSAFAVQPIYPPRTFDPDNVARLKTLFCDEGIKRKNKENRIDILLSQANFQEALYNSGLSEKDLIEHSPQELPLIKMPLGTVRYLHGHHRLVAAKQLLPQKDQWWGINIYLDGELASLIN
jgi:hypothetical protein